MRPRSTAWIEQLSGSMSTANSIGSSTRNTVDQRLRRKAQVVHQRAVDDVLKAEDRCGPGTSSTARAGNIDTRQQGTICSAMTRSPSEVPCLSGALAQGDDVSRNS